MDEQVKIRGFRVELGEIESVLADHESVRQAAVVAREDGPGGKRLVAYVAGQVPSIAELREYVGQRLPDYMTPSLFVMLDELPLNANGKVDRNALPVPDLTQPGDDPCIAPRNPDEHSIASIWTSLFGAPPSSIHTSFFEIGGHSLLAMQMISRIALVLKTELPIRALFETPTIAGLAAAVADARSRSAPAIMAPIMPVSRPVRHSP
jgi:hypothetical protein